MKIGVLLSLIVVSIVGLVGFQSCKNEVEIFAPEKDVTVIYGLLNSDDAVHQFKINRVFQGEDAVANLAKDPTLSEYEDIDARLFELLNDGFGGYDTTNEWTLTERTITDKDSGYFYYPNQKIYEVAAAISNRMEYAIMVDKKDGSPIVESTTELVRVNGDILLKPFGLNFLGLSLADNNGPIEKINLEMKMPVNGKVIEVYLDFSWADEFYSSATPVEHTISFKVGTYLASNIPTQDADVEIIKAELNPTAFYEFIAANAPVVPSGSDLKQRVAKDEPLNFRFVTGGVEFNTYLEVASPSTSLLETKPEYTNVINGVGLFSCRSFDNKISLMSQKSIVYLVDGEIMAGRRFCNYSNSTDPNYCF